MPPAPVVDTLIARLAAGPEGQRAFLIFETLAERTLALAQLRRRADPDAGYEPLLDDMLRPVLARCLAHGIRIVSNFGAANPRAAARHIARMARELGADAPRIAVVEGDDLSGPAHRALLNEALGEQMNGLRVVSANAYIGAEPLPPRWMRARRSWCAAAWPTRRSPSARPCRTSAGAPTTGTGWAARPWRATCWSAARRCAAATSRTPATRTCPGWRRWASPSRRSTATATAPSARPMPPAAS
jgi:hypothetical protein